MSPNRHHGSRRIRGFTLVEVIAVVVLLGIAAATLMKIQANLVFLKGGVTTTQVLSQLQLACAEQVLNVAQEDGITALDSQAGRFNDNPAQCDNLTAYGGNAVPAVTVTDGSTAAACPANTPCRLVSVQAGSLQPLVFLVSGS